VTAFLRAEQEQSIHIRLDLGRHLGWLLVGEVGCQVAAEKRRVR
jgi:hypothetical protein